MPTTFVRDQNEKQGIADFIPYLFLRGKSNEKLSFLSFDEKSNKMSIQEI